MAWIKLKLLQKPEDQRMDNFSNYNSCLQHLVWHFTTHNIRSSTSKSCVSAHDITKSSHFSWRTPHLKHVSAEQSIKAYLMFSMAWIKYSGERLIAEINKGDMKISCIPCVQQGRPKKTIWSLVRRKPAKDVTTIRPPICDLTLSSGLDFKAIREKYSHRLI